MKLVIAEKSSVAGTIADIIGAKSKKDGFYEGNGYVVTYCVGHLIKNYDPDHYDEKYKKWDISLLPIIPQDWKMNAVDRTKKQLSVVKELMKRSDITTIVNACDAGREGEMICMELYEHFKCKKPVQRLWISSMEEKAIKEGFNGLKDGKEYENLYQAAVCRSQADWLVGMNFTRLYSSLYRADSVLSIGRVQTPTLAMIVKRDDIIKKFTKVPFFEVHLDGKGFIAKSVRIDNKAQAERVVGKCDGETAVIKKVEGKHKKENCPRLHDLTNLQKEANTLFGYPAASTLNIVQELYEKKILTYPRTDSQFITEDMKDGIPSLVASIAGLMSYELMREDDLDKSPSEITKPTYTTHPLYAGWSRIADNSKVSDHHAILPTPSAATADLSGLSAEHKNIFNLVCTKLLCATNIPHSYIETSVTVEAQGSIFTAKGRKVEAVGWKAIQTAFYQSIGRKKEDDETKSLPQLTEGEQYNPKALLHEGTTSPPKPYTEATLLADMERAGAEDMPDDVERKGIGTPATRASTIETLLDRKYVERKGKNILSTEKGRSLIAVLPENDPVKEPLLTAEWETALKEVEKGNKSPKEFMQSIEQYITVSIQNNSKPTEAGLKMFPPRLFTARQMEEKDILGKCARCGSNVIEFAKVYGCAKNCGFALFKESNFLKSMGGKPITNAQAKSLFTKGTITVKGLKSKAGKAFDGEFELDDKGTGWLGLKFADKKGT